MRPAYCRNAGQGWKSAAIPSHSLDYSGRAALLAVARLRISRFRSARAAISIARVTARGPNGSVLTSPREPDFNTSRAGLTSRAQAREQEIGKPSSVVARIFSHSLRDWAAGPGTGTLQFPLSLADSGGWLAELLRNGAFSEFNEEKLGQRVRGNPLAIRSRGASAT